MKLLLVDDNREILEGLRVSIDWEGVGIEQLLTAEDAEAARETVKNTTIDILMTDIEMPGENGLELWEWMRENRPSVICIFLTSHADFSYAQEAIHKGGFDYILQPARPSDIEAVVRRCRDYILEKKRKEILYEKGYEYDKIKQKALEGLAYALFQRGKLFTGRLAEWETMVNPDGQYKCYQPCIYVFPDSLQPEELSHMKEYVANRLDSFYENKNYILSVSYPNQLGIVILCAHEPERDIIRDQLIALKSEIEEHYHQQSALYISMTGREDLPQLVGQLIELQKNNVSKRMEVYYTNTPQRSIQLKNPDKEKWALWIGQGDGVLVINQIDGMVRFMDEAGQLSQEYMQILFQSFSDACSMACHRYGFHMSDLFEKYYTQESFINSCYSVADFKCAVEFCIKRFDQLKEHGDKTRVMSVEERIHLVERYIDENLSENIVRTDVASMVFLNEDYFSRLFKNITGLGFKEYVMKQKMEYSKKLLKETKFPVGAIASKAGYDNFSNFTQAFKKFTGVTPQDYRKDAEKSQNQ